MIAFGPDPEGATPLTADDVVGLRLSWISTQAELNQAEAENILRARSWAGRTRRAAFWYLPTDGIKELHRRMFGEVWSWAGQVRQRETNIGIAPHLIQMSLRDLHEDTVAQIGDGTALAYPLDELAVRFHHRLVLIHPFRNGNGRHARLATDLLMADLGGSPLVWGGSELTCVGHLRAEYLAALRHADRHLDFGPLITFARRPPG